MTESLTVNIAVEGELDVAVLRKVLDFAGIEIENVYGRKGKNDLQNKVREYNQAAEHRRWVMLVDLNSDEECPPPFINSWLPNPNPNLQLRVAVRAVEAWLLADRKKMAQFLSVPAQKIPLQPENEANPKKTLINIARRSRSKTIRKDIVPSEGSTATQGPGYTSRLIEFAVNYWDPGRAANHAPSLKRSINSLSQWKLDKNRFKSQG